MFGTWRGAWYLVFCSEHDMLFTPFWQNTGAELNYWSNDLITWRPLHVLEKQFSAKLVFYTNTGRNDTNGYLASLSRANVTFCSPSITLYQHCKQIQLSMYKMKLASPVQKVEILWGNPYRLPTADSWFEIVDPCQEVWDAPMHLKNPVLGYTPV